MTRRLALVALWLAATVFAVLLASFAVRLAGDKVVAEGPATVTRGQVEADLTAAPGTTAPTATTPPSSAATVPPDPAAAVVPGAPTTATSVPAGGAAPRAGDDPALAPGSGPGAGSGSGSGSGSATPTTSTTPAGGDDGPTASSPPAPVATTEAPAVEQSFPLVGGSVRMRCVGTTASLVSSSPNPGYSMDVRSAGPREIEVRFTSADHTSELKGSCAGGAITAEPKESGGGGGDGSGRDG